MFLMTLQFIFFLLICFHGRKHKACARYQLARTSLGGGKAPLLRSLWFENSSLTLRRRLSSPSKPPLCAWSMGRCRLCTRQQTTTQTKINGPDDIKSPTRQLNPGTFYSESAWKGHTLRTSRWLPARDAEQSDGCLLIISWRLLFKPIKPLARSAAMISLCRAYQVGTNQSVQTRLVLLLQVWRGKRKQS